MGKGYNNYMTKKPFHPGSKANIKRTWMAEQRTENEKRKQEELKAQYDKEQDLYNNRALLSTESKDKLELNFMYEAPPGAKRERQKEDDEPEYKFEWQRKYSAPREDYAKGNAEIRDQPFGIPVRNVRCIKCHKWGHINTDKECPLYSHASSSSMPTTSMDPLELMRQMREDGYDLKKSALGHQHNPKQPNQQFIASDEESDPEMDFLKSLTPKQKRILLKKLNRLSKKQKKKDEVKKKKDKKKQKAKSKKRAAESDAESDQKSEQKKKKKKKKERLESSDSESTSDSSVDEKEGKANLTPKERKAKATNDDTTKNAISSDTKHKKTKSDISFSKNSYEDEASSIKKLKKTMSASDVIKKSSNDTKSEKSSTKGKNSSDVAESDSHKNTADKKTSETEACGSGTSSQGSSTKPTSSAKTSKHKNPSTQSNSSSSDEDSSENTKAEGKRSKSKRSRKDVSASCSESKEVLKPSHKPSMTMSPESSASKVADDTPKSSTVDENYHPDGFDPVYPQRTCENSDIATKHDGGLRDRFRDRHRHRRSPSVKHKYRQE